LNRFQAQAKEHEDVKRYAPATFLSIKHEAARSMRNLPTEQQHTFERCKKKRIKTRTNPRAIISIESAQGSSHREQSTHMGTVEWKQPGT
jgi:hypothetical protein